MGVVTGWVTGNAIFLSTNAQMPEVESWHTSTVWYEDSARIFLSEKVDCQ